MKKLIVYILLTLSLLWSVTFIAPLSQLHAADSVTVSVTEKIPGAGCGSKKADGTYECNVKTWFGAVMAMIGQLIKYFTYIASLGGVLFIVINGILYSMSGIEPGMKDEAKKRIVKTLMGLVVLLLSWLILNAIAPWVYV